MARRSTETTAPPVLLQRLYGQDRVVCLRELLLGLAQQGSPANAEELRRTLEQRFDHASYTKLLSDTFGVVKSACPPLVEGFTLRAASNQLELLHRAIEALLQSPAGKTNVLCYGYRKKRPSKANSGKQLQGTANTEEFHANSVADSLMSSSWQLLLSRIGDTLMLYLLYNVTMFTRLENDCCLQLTGPSIAQVARDWRRGSGLARVLSEEQLQLEKQRQQRQELAEAILRPPAQEPLAVATQDPFPDSDMVQEGAQGEEEPAQGTDAAPTAGKNGRLSSWQRRKARRMQAQEEVQAEVPFSVPSTQPLAGSAEPAPEPAPERDAAVTRGGIDAVATHAQWPKCMPKFADMVINRNAVMYCRTFSPHPGFTAKHMLNVLRGRRDAGRTLYAAIFNPMYNPMGRALRTFLPLSLLLPPPPIRIPANRAHVATLLQKLAKRAAKCPYGLLLSLSCPLPRHLRQSMGGGATAAEVKADGLMQDLYELEQQAQQQQPQQQQQAAQPPPAAAEAGAGAAAGAGRRRLRATGLGQLIQEAGSQLDPSVAVGSGLSGSGPPERQPLPAATQPQELSTDGGGAAGTARATAPAAMEVDGVAEGGGGIPPLQPPPPPSLGACFVPHAQVSAFVWAVVRSIVPNALLGSKRCRRALQRSIRRFVSLRRYEQMSVQHIMQRIPTSALLWLHPHGRPSTHTPPSQAASQQRTLALWLGWLFSVVVVPLLRAHFYCTESEAYRLQVFYYRKPVWAKLASEAIDGLLDGQFEPLSDAQALQTLKGRRMGVAKLRLLPKRKGMRFIINMGRPSMVLFPAKRTAAGRRLPPTTLKFLSVNSTLQAVHQVLKLEVSRQPEALGASALGYNDSFTKLQPWIRKWRAFSKVTPDPEPPYVVSVDVSRAFDNVKVDTLMTLLRDLLQSQEYLVLNYSEVVPAMGDVRVVPRRLAVPAGCDACDGSHSGFPMRAAQWAATRKGKAFVDGVVYERVTRDHAIKTLRDHLTANLVRLRGVWHYQSRGIAQGSTLGSLLCCLYLAHVERTCLEPVIAAVPSLPAVYLPLPPPRQQSAGAAASSGAGGLTALGHAAVVEGSAVTGGAAGAAGLSFHRSSAKKLPSHSVLVRHIDDWLLVTYRREVAEAVARRLLADIPEYNIAVNPDKTKLSFALRGAPGSPDVHPTLFETGDGSKFIQWCGLLLNAATLEIQGDYSRYAGEHIATSLTLPARQGPGASLDAKLCMYLRPKVHPLLLDPAINSATTIRVNVYQAFAIGAMKFHCFVRALPAAPAPNSSMLMRAVETGIGFMCKLTRPRQVASSLCPGAALVSCDPGVSTAHVRYLGLHAFRHVLARKQHAYARFLAELGEALAAPACKRCAKDLAAAVDPGRSTILDAILY